MRNALLVLVAAVALAGCGSNDDSRSSDAAATLSSLKATSAVAPSTTTAPSTIAPSSVVPTTLTTPAPAARAPLTADWVVSAIRRADLPVNNAVDQSSKLCPGTSGCVHLVAAEGISVYEFGDADHAARWASRFPLGYQRGAIYLRFTRDGKHATDPALIPQYQAVLDSLQ